ncbi:MAG: hypothetical protein APF77_12305 [Clostridia bacterium BRH_c25]|nr:MAG: hypothetical protein APF77_12305 [Clostridia bacterium BRH_c25]
MSEIKFGVSPAFLLSKFGEGFTPEQVCEAFTHIKQLGFDCYQAEIVTEDKLSLWLNGGARKVREAADRIGLSMSQFVAHFMLEAFKNEDAVLSSYGIAEMNQVFDITSVLKEGTPITVPFGSYPEKGNKQIYLAMVEKMRIIAEEAERRGFPLAIEVQPGALIKGADGIRQFADDVGYHTGYNLDTGHAWASGYDVVQYPQILHGYIYGTHLCDNDGITNLSLRPGSSTIQFEKLLPQLLKSGYSSSLDLEIFTSPDKTDEEYTEGLAYIKGKISRQ